MQACKAGRGLNLNLRDEADRLGFCAEGTLSILKQSAAYQTMAMLVCFIDLPGLVWFNVLEDRYTSSARLH